MNKGWRLALLTSLIATVAFAYAPTAFATGTYYVDADTGDDANNCTTAETPCKTFAATKTLIVALGDPSNTTVKFSGTLNESIQFDDADVVAPLRLDGLRLTAADSNNQPVINTPGAIAVQINDLNAVTIDHLTITGGTEGISVSGSATTLSNDIRVQNNTISGVAVDSTFTAIHIQYAKNVRVHHNSVHDITYNLFDKTGYSTNILMNFYQLSEANIHHNTLQAITQTNTISGVTSHSTYLYGFSLSLIDHSNIHHNTISGLSNVATASVAGSTHTLYTYGMYSSVLVASSLSANTINNISSTVEANFDETRATATATGLYLVDARAGTGTMVIADNTIEQIHSTQTASSGSPTARGADLLYLYGVTIKNNTIDYVTTNATTTGEEVSTGGTATGLSGPYLGDNVLVQNNTIKHVVTNVTYSGVGTTSSSIIFGYYLYSATNVTVKNNTIEELSWSVNNNNMAEYYDNITIYGMYLSYGNIVLAQNNTVGNIVSDYSSAGTLGTASIYTDGIAAFYDDQLTLEKNTIQNIAVTAAVTDATDGSQLYLSMLPLDVRSGGMTLRKNIVRQIESVANGGHANGLTHNAYGIYTLGDGVITGNKITDYTQTTTTANSATHRWYGISTSATDHLEIDHNTIKGVTTSSSGTVSTHITAGIYVGKGTDVSVYNNQIRGVTSTADNTEDHKMYGVWFYTDATGARVLNNVLMGKTDFTGQESAGVYLPSGSSIDIDLIHNTFANWLYPLWLGGGTKVYAKNNILSASGGTSYALAVGRNFVDADTFKSDYNVLYNATAPEQLVYDTDNTVAIALGDWTNEGGSFGYDLHSLNADPKLTAQGRLSAASPAKNAGSNDYPYVKKDPEWKILALDINATKRPLQKANKIDIGADEFKGK